MREIISIQCGQAGNQIGAKFWEAIRQEHQISTDGKFQPKTPVAGSPTNTGKGNYCLDKINVYFTQTSQKRFVPRTVLVDLEPGVIDNIKGSTQGGLFHPDNMICGDNGAGNNWAKGYYTEGAEMVEQIMDSLRREAENCDCLQGFQLTHSLGGGTGSGLGTLILSKVREEYPDRMISTFSIFPNPDTSDTIVEPYNTTLAMHQLIEVADAVFCVDNKALYDITSKYLKIEKASFSDLNQLVTRVMSGITSSLRFPGQLNSDLRKMSVNLVPFPRNHFFIPSSAPLLSTADRNHTVMDVKQLAMQVFDPNNMMVKADTRVGRYFTAAVMFRGPANMRSIEETILTMRNRMSANFFQWIPNGVQVSQCNVATYGDEMSATFIGNSTSISQLFTRVLSDFSAMFRRKAFVYNYANEGMDDMEFTEAESNMQDLVDSYQESNYTDISDSEAEEGDLDGDYSSSSFDLSGLEEST